MWTCRPSSSRPSSPETRSISARLVERDAELRLRAARVDRGVREPRHGRVDADQDAPAAGSEADEPVDVVGVVDHDQADAGGQRVADVAVALGVAMQEDVLRVEPGRQRDRELDRGGDVAAEPLAREDAQDGRAGQRLGGEVDLGARVARGELAHVLARGLAQALLVEHEGRRAELGGHVGERDAADRQAAVNECRGPRKEFHGAAYCRAMDRREVGVPTSVCRRPS